MSTILFNEIIFGPIKSRRLGTSLGVNLLPRNGKWCNFDCLYCECGFNKDGKDDRKLPKREDVSTSLERVLAHYSASGEKIDTITFSGNGEPTMHPDFAEIIEDTLNLRNRYVPDAKVSVLSNGSGISKKETSEALTKVDNAILKVDSAFDRTTILINRPAYAYSIRKLKRELEPLKGRFVLQTMFLRGEFEGEVIDNTTPEEIAAWQALAAELDPREIMIYTIDRETPAKNLSKVTIQEMEQIAAPLRERGYIVKISG